MTSSLSTQKIAPLPLQTSDLCHRSGSNCCCHVTHSTAQSGSFPCELCKARIASNPLCNGLRAKSGRWIWDQKNRSSFLPYRSYYLPDRDPLCDSVTVKEAPPYIESFFDKYCTLDGPDIDEVMSRFVPNSHQIRDRKQTPICEEIRGEF